MSRREATLASALPCLFALTAAASHVKVAAAASSSPASRELQKTYDGYSSTYDSLDGGPLAKALGLEVRDPTALCTLAAHARHRKDGPSLTRELFLCLHPLSVPAPS